MRLGKVYTQKSLDKIYTNGCSSSDTNKVENNFCFHTHTHRQSQQTPNSDCENEMRPGDVMVSNGPKARYKDL